MPTKKIQIGNSIVCEYATMGQNNKHVLVNVYSGDIVVANVPADISVGIYIEIIETEKNPAPPEFSFELLLNDKILMKGTANSAAGKSAGVLLIRSVRIRAEEKETTLEAVLSADGYSRITALRKKIILGKVPQL